MSRPHPVAKFQHGPCVGLRAAPVRALGHVVPLRERTHLAAGLASREAVRRVQLLGRALAFRTGARDLRLEFLRHVGRSEEDSAQPRQRRFGVEAVVVLVAVADLQEAGLGESRERAHVDVVVRARGGVGVFVVVVDRQVLGMPCELVGPLDVLDHALVRAALVEDHRLRRHGDQGLDVRAARRTAAAGQVGGGQLARHAVAGEVVVDKRRDVRDEQRRVKALHRAHRHAGHRDLRLVHERMRLEVIHEDGDLAGHQLGDAGAELLHQLAETPARRPPRHVVRRAVRRADVLERDGDHAGLDVPPRLAVADRIARKVGVLVAHQALKRRAGAREAEHHGRLTLFCPVRHERPSADGRARVGMALIHAQRVAVALLAGDELHGRFLRLPRQVAAVVAREVVLLPRQKRFAVLEERMRGRLRGVRLLLPRPGHGLCRAPVGALRREVLHARRAGLPGQPRLRHLSTRRKSNDRGDHHERLFQVHKARIPYRTRRRVPLALPSRTTSAPVPEMRGETRCPDVALYVPAWHCRPFAHSSFTVASPE